MDSAWTAGSAANAPGGQPPVPSGPGYRKVSPSHSSSFTEVIVTTGPGGRRLAVKRLKRQFSDHPAAQQALIHEYQVLSEVQGPGVVPLEGWLGMPGRSFATQYLAYGDLVPLIGASLQTWQRPLAGLARALDRIHQRGWVHRDVKAQNAMFSLPSMALWIDFSAAAPAGGSSVALSRGTKCCASPQQWAGLPPSPRDDVYSFGALLYQLLTGHLPPPPDGHLAGGLGKVEDVPPPLSRWMAAALAARSSARPADLYWIAQILEGNCE